MEAKQVLSEFPRIVDDSRVWFGHYLLLCFGWAEFLGMAGSYICISSSNFYFSWSSLFEFTLHKGVDSPSWKVPVCVPPTKRKTITKHFLFLVFLSRHIVSYGRVSFGISNNILFPAPIASSHWGTSPHHIVPPCLIIFRHLNSCYKLQKKGVKYNMNNTDDATRRLNRFLRSLPFASLSILCD